MRIPKNWVDELVEICFLDHTQDAYSIGSLVARGRLAAIEFDSIQLMAWETDTIKNTDGVSVKDETARIPFWIVRSCITSITRLERKETKHAR